MGKIRVYSFGAANTDTNQVGTFFFTAKNKDEAIQHANDVWADKDSGIDRCGYIGWPDSLGWQEADFRLGFVDADTLEAEMRAKMPEVDHDPQMLAEFVERNGRQPKRGNVLKRNLLSNGVFEIHPDTPSYCDPSCESYHSM